MNYHQTILNELTSEHLCNAITPRTHSSMLQLALLLTGQGCLYVCVCLCVFKWGPGTAALYVFYYYELYV